MDEPERQSLRTALTRVAVALKESGHRFALAGGYAAWTLGSPEPDHDVDFLVREEEADQIAGELEQEGFTVERPAEDWLLKAHADDVVVDLLFRTQGSDVDSMLRDAQELSVLSVRMPVLTANDVVVEKLLALDEHYCDLATVLPAARALREQVDWEEVRRRTTGRPFAEAALFLLERLAVIAPG
jgi:predicted nucleotidyltransferase